MNENYEENESGLIRPDLINKPRLKKTSIEPTEDTLPVQSYVKESTGGKYNNYGSSVKISLESGGRFGNPETLVFKDYTAKQVNDLVTSKEEDLLETVIAILTECVIEPKGFDIGKLTNEEFYEVLLGMKVAFDSPALKHKWVHDCQDNVPDKDKQLSEETIDLRDVQFKSIESADDKIREFYKARFEELSQEQFKDYLNKKYGSDNGLSIEDELKEIRIKEPFLIPGAEKDYQFNFMRIGNLVEAYKIASKEFDSKIRIERNRSLHGVPKEQMQVMREEAIEKLNMQKARATIRYSQALCLNAVKENGSVRNLRTFEEKVKEYNDIPKSVMFGYIKAIEAVQYGVDHELEVECNLCGSKERRSLQRFINPFELLPISNVENNDSSGKFRRNTVIDFCF